MRRIKVYLNESGKFLGYLGDHGTLVGYNDAPSWNINYRYSVNGYSDNDITLKPE